MNLYQDEPDVEWTCGQGALGEPVLAVQTTSPMLSAGFLGLDVTTIKAQVLSDGRPESTFVLHQGNILEPILACPVEDLLRPLFRCLEQGSPWVLVLQFLVEGEKHARMFVVEGQVVVPVEREGVSVIFGWPVMMV